MHVHVGYVCDWPLQSLQSLHCSTYYTGQAELITISKAPKISPNFAQLHVTHAKSKRPCTNLERRYGPLLVCPLGESPHGIGMAAQCLKIQGNLGKILPGLPGIGRIVLLYNVDNLGPHWRVWHEHVGIAPVQKAGEPRHGQAPMLGWCKELESLYWIGKITP